MSEAIEELRNGRGVAETYFPTAHPFGVGPNAAPPKPEGVPSELADIVIRALDCADAWGIDLEQMVELKLAHNASRGHRHGRETRMRSKAKAAATVAYPDGEYTSPPVIAALREAFVKGWDAAWPLGERPSNAPNPVLGVEGPGEPEGLATASTASDEPTEVDRFADIAAAQFQSDLDYDGAEIKRRILITAHILAPDHPTAPGECLVCADDDGLDYREEPYV